MAKVCECIVGALFAALGLVALMEVGETAYYGIRRAWRERANQEKDKGK